MIPEPTATSECLRIVEVVAAWNVIHSFVGEEKFVVLIFTNSSLLAKMWNKSLAKITNHTVANNSVLASLPGLRHHSVFDHQIEGGRPGSSYHMQWCNIMWCNDEGQCSSKNLQGQRTGDQKIQKVQQLTVWYTDQRKVINSKLVNYNGADHEISIFVESKTRSGEGLGMRLIQWYKASILVGTVPWNPHHWGRFPVW